MRHPIITSHLFTLPFPPFPPLPCPKSSPPVAGTRGPLKPQVWTMSFPKRAPNSQSPDARVPIESSLEVSKFPKSKLRNQNGLFCGRAIHVLQMDVYNIYISMYFVSMCKYPTSRCRWICLSFFFWQMFIGQTMKLTEPLQAQIPI